MKYLQQLVKNLSNKERLVLESIYQSSGNSKNSKRYRLFKSILENEVKSDQQACELLYNSKNGPSYSQLKKRLQHDILNVMVTEDGRSIHSSRYFQAKHQSKQYIMDAEILFARGLDDVGVHLLKKAKKLADKFELTYEQMIIADLLQRNEGQKKGMKLFDYYSNLKFQYLNLISTKFTAFQLYNQIMLPNLFRKNKEDSYVNECHKIVKELELMHSQSGSREILSLYLRANAYLGHLTKDYNSSYKAAIEFLKFIDSDPIMNSKSNLAGAHMQLAIIQVYRENFQSSNDHIHSSLKLFADGTTNHLRALNVYFQCSFMSKDYGSCHEILKSVSLSRTFRSKGFMREIWKLRNASLLFAERDYDSSLSELQKGNDLLSDKSGWRVGCLVLEIMCILELEYFDWVEYRIESLRKLMHTIKDSRNKRSEIIYKILKGLLKRDFEYSKIASEYENEINLISRDKKDYSWDPFGHELFPFHWWIKSKCLARMNS